MRVLFSKRYGAYWPGASPNLDDDVAKQQIAEGNATEWTEASEKKLRQEIAAQEGGVQLAPPGNTPNQPVINMSGGPVPTEYPPLLRSPMKAVDTPGETIEPAEAEGETHPLAELGLDTRVSNALTAGGLKDAEAVQKYADENEDFTGIEGVGPAGNDQIRAALKKRAKKSG